MRKITLLLSGVLMSAGISAQISTFPDFQDFESQTLCGTSCTGSCNPTGSWRNADQWAFPQAGTDWLIEDGATPSTATGPDVDHTTGTATGKYMYVETSGCNNVTAHLVSDIYDFTAVSAPRISFWWHMYGATMGQMHLDVDTTGTGVWVDDVIPAWTDNVNTWQFTDVTLPAYVSGRSSVRIRFRFNTGTSFTSDAGLDDILVYQPAANDINLTNVTVGGGCGNSICTPVELTLVNTGSDTINAGTMIPVSFMVNAVVVTDTFTAPVNILPGDTVIYTFQNGCVDLSGPSAVSVDAWTSWSLDLAAGNDSASTVAYGIPIIATYPYYEDFESGQNGWVIDNNANGTWAFGTPAKTTINGAASGSNAFVTGGLGTGTYNDLDNSWVEGPCFDMTNMCDPVISLSVWWNSEFSWDGMNIVTSIDGGLTWQLQGAYLDPLNWYTDNTIVGAPGGYQEGWSGRASTTNGSGGWVTARHHLAGVAGNPSVKIRIAYGTDGSVTDDGVAFDNILIADGAYIGADQLVCSPATATLDANFGAPLTVTYLWSTGATTDNITVSATDWYWVDVTNGACTTRDSMYFVSVDANSDVALGADTTLCSAAAFTFDAGYWPQSTYLWSDNSTAQTLTTSTPGTYHVTVTNACGTMVDSITVAVDSAMVNLGADTATCGTPVTFDAGSANTTWIWSNGGTSQTESFSSTGTYYVDVMNASGCTASDTVAVTINTPPTVAINSNSPICSGDMAVMTAVGATQFIWVNGPPMATYALPLTADSSFWVVGTDTATGCMDTAMVMISVLQPSAMSQSVSLCYGDSIVVGANTYTTSGMYMDTLANAAGCDSVITTTLVVDTLNMSSQSFTGCDGYTVTVGANTYNASGTYMDTLSNWMGCDSIVTTTLVINSVNTGVSVSANGVVLTANNASAVSYQWLDCATMQPIAGATSVSYTATANGNYAVVIDDGTCTDTSACTAVTDVTITEATTDYSFNVFPNPTVGNVTIATSKPTQVVIFNALGEAVIAQQVLNTVTLDLTALESGVYFIRTTEGKVVRLVKE